MARTRQPAGSAVSRTERRKAAKARRSRLMLIGAAVVSVVVVVAWFPASALYSQHQQIATTSTQLAELRQQDAALGQERRNLSNSAEIERIARQQYDLVKPGQQIYEVLPGNKGATGSGTGAADPGDPGLTAPVVPSGESELPAGSGSDHTASESGSGTTDGHVGSRTSNSSSIIGRILQTLEFWR